ncbi:MAG: hypothetical protein J1F32_04855 [Erysipelotrichales bacterium]|nr:hypothetical protein [Erysipelotrichales bacterium]
MKKRFFQVFILLTALVIMSIPLTIAYFKADANNVNNSFTPAESIMPTVEETFENGEKKDVFIKVGNPGYPVYVRATIIFNWKDENGNTYYNKPIINQDYEIVLNDADWNLSDRFYYYNKSVASGGQTTNLINSCKLKDNVTAPEGFTFDVEIIAQTIQAVGTTDDTDSAAIEDAWGYFPN